MPPRTIDNLGVDVSTRYAEDQKILDQSFIKESRGIPIDTEIEVTMPSFSAEVESLLRTQPTNVTWASFMAPPYYFEQRKRLFTYQMIPSMGSEDKQESQAQKILAKLQSMTGKGGVPQEKEQKYEREIAPEPGKGVNKVEKKDVTPQEIQQKLEGLKAPELGVQRTPAAPQDIRKKYHEERALEEEDRERKILTTLLDTVSLFDKLIIEINAKRSQYQKG